MATNKKIDPVVIGGKKGRKKTQLDYTRLRKVVLVLRALNHELRHKIIELLHKNDELPVTQIYQQLRMEQSVASQHLAILRRAGVVGTERRGKYIFYSLNEERIDEVKRLIGNVAQASA